MDDLEFRKRALANPYDTDADFVAAAATSPSRQKLVQELQTLDSRLHEVLQSVTVPTDLAQRLKSREIRTPAPKAKTTFSRYYALAASLVIAVGVTMSVGLQSARPSAADLQFHDEVLSHLYREAPRYHSGLEDISWQQISQVMTEAGGHLREDERIKTLHIKFANDCNIVPATRGAHIVLEGTKGSVSVIIINNSPVTTKFDVNDPRFAGRIIPFGVGNLIIVGEKEEPLETYEALITDAFEWVI